MLSLSLENESIVVRKRRKAPAIKKALIAVRQGRLKGSAHGKFKYLFKRMQKREQVLVQFSNNDLPLFESWYQKNFADLEKDLFRNKKEFGQLEKLVSAIEYTCKVQPQLNPSDLYGLYLFQNEAFEKIIQMHQQAQPFSEENVFEEPAWKQFQAEQNLNRVQKGGKKLSDIYNELFDGQELELLETLKTRKVRKTKAEKLNTQFNDSKLREKYLWLAKNIHPDAQSEIEDPLWFEACEAYKSKNLQLLNCICSYFLLTQKGFNARKCSILEIEEALIYLKQKCVAVDDRFRKIRLHPAFEIKKRTSQNLKKLSEKMNLFFNQENTRLGKSIAKNKKKLKTWERQAFRFNPLNKKSKRLVKKKQSHHPFNQLQTASLFE